LLIWHSKHITNVSFKRYSAVDYFLLYDVLSNYDWAPLYE
jgi:hypothetical protein